MKKSFFNIAELSEKLSIQEDGIMEVANQQDDHKDIHLRLMLWQVRVNLAIAQQLAVISGHLGEIVSKSKAAADV